MEVSGRRWAPLQRFGRNPRANTVEAFGRRLGALGKPPEAHGSCGSPWTTPGTRLEALGRSLKALSASLDAIGRSWKALGRPLDAIGRSCKALGRPRKVPRALWKSWGARGRSWQQVSGGLRQCLAGLWKLLERPGNPWSLAGSHWKQWKPVDSAWQAFGNHWKVSGGSVGVIGRGSKDLGGPGKTLYGLRRPVEVVGRLWAVLKVLQRPWAFLESLGRSWSAHGSPWERR